MSAPVGDAPTDQGTRWVAVLLAAAAIVAAILATRAAFLGNEANDAWQRSLRTEIKRGALLTIAVRYVYGAEAGQAFEIAKHEILAHEMRARAADLDPAVAEVLLREASIHETVISQARTTMEVASERYALPDGGYDLALRLADERAGNADALALDPHPIQAQGDRASRHSVVTLAGSVPVGVAFLMGSLAMPWRRRRRVLLVLAWLAVLSGAAVGLSVEVLP